MRGTYKITVRKTRVSFTFEVRRNITVLRGMSATGKTTLVDMVGEYARSGPASGIRLQCDRPCRVLDGDAWQVVLGTITGSIVFIDEGAPFILAREFARAIRGTDNYYVIVARYPMPALPYSVEEVYQLKNTARRKVAGASRVYTRTKRMYDTHTSRGAELSRTTPELVVVEDSRAGLAFFNAYFEARGIECVTARGKANVVNTVADAADKRVLVIADGAAFGSEMDALLALSKYQEISLFLPESFEWLLLRSGVVRGGEIADMLRNPSDHIESAEYFSWEQFFTEYLSQVTEGSPLRYTKERLNPAYLEPANMQKVLDAE